MQENEMKKRKIEQSRREKEVSEDGKPEEVAGIDFNNTSINRRRNLNRILISVIDLAITVGDKSMCILFDLCGECTDSHLSLANCKINEKTKFRNIAANVRCYTNQVAAAFSIVFFCNGIFACLYFDMFDFK